MQITAVNRVRIIESLFAPSKSPAPSACPTRIPTAYPSATKINQENRIKLMLAVARENLDNELNSGSSEDASSENKVKEAATA